MELKENELKKIRTLTSEYKDYSEDDLYITLYENYIEESTKFRMEITGVETIKQKIIAGKRIFESVERSAYNIICCVLKGETTDLTGIAQALLTFMGFAAAITSTLAAIIIKIGVSIFCKNCKSKYGKCEE
ncbi:MAG: hypothetical protein K8E24_009680 [Methanobacterium paludis]|nr:hypothetical protein [Methanobacterium paludis]